MKKLLQLITSTKQLPLITVLLLFFVMSLSVRAQMPITGNDALRCGAGELTLQVNWSNAALNPANVKWYTQPFYGTPIATGLSYSTPYLERTTAYYVDYIGDGGCSQCDRLLIRAVIADQVITPQVIYTSLVFCNSANENFLPTVVGANGGTFSINPAVGGGSFSTTSGVFNPLGLTAGVYVVTFQPEEIIGCDSNPVTVNLTVTNAPVQPAISYAEVSYCSSSGTVSVSRTGAAGGTYSASPSGLTINSTSGMITPATSQTGNYTITYLVPGGGGCAPVSASTVVSILKLPTATISYSGPFTQNQGPQQVALTGTDNYLGGTFSVEPAGLSLNATTGEITPSTSSAGTYTVTYKKPNASPCTGDLTATASVEIFGLPSASIEADITEVCLQASELIITFIGSGGVAPYTFSYQIGAGPVFELATNEADNFVNLNVPTIIAGSFTYKILSVTDGNSSTLTYTGGLEPSITLTVTSPPVASFEYSGTPYCSNSSNPAVTLLNNGVAGTFSSTAGLVFADVATGEINIASSTAGTYTVTNTIASTGGCSVVTYNAVVKITSLPIAGFSYTNATYCQLDVDPTVNLATGAQHGVYTSDPIGIVFLADGSINLSESDPNTYTIYNTVAAADGCALVQESTQITITPEIIISTPVFNAGATTSRCQAAETLDIYGATSSGSANITYSYALDAASITGGNSINATTGAVSWAAGWQGTSEITVTVSAPCAQNKTAVHTVTTNPSGSLDTPTFVLGASSTRCQASSNIAYELSNLNAQFNYNYELDATSIAGGNVSFAFTNNIEWSAAWYGVSTLRVTASSGCSSSPPAIHTITTNPVPAIPTGTDVTVTYDGQIHTGSASSSVPLIAGGSTAANIVWYDASTGGNVVSAPSGTNVGTYIAYAEAVAPGTACISTARTLVTVTIHQRPLTASSTITDKIYNGLAATGTVNLGTVSNLVGTQTLIITPTATDFADANAEIGKATTISYSLQNGANGGLAANYSMAALASSGNITARLLTIENPSITKTKVYDGNTTVVVSAGNFTNKVGSDDVTVSAVANYDNANFGTGKTITVAYTIGGSAAGNYTKPVDFTANDGEITKKELTISGAVAQNKVYDGTNVATVVFTGASLVGVVGAEAVTINSSAYAATFAQINVGTGIAVTVTGVTLNGVGAANYTLAQPTGLTANITVAPLTITANNYEKGFGEVLVSPTTGSTSFTVGAGQLKGTDNVTSVTITYLNDVHTAGKAVGTYANSIAPSAAVGTGLTNYNITYVNSTMIIYEVIVTATAGTARKGYNTLKAAYDAINAGTHTGVITVKVYANTTETATATLNKSGEGPANYTSVSIIPEANVTISGSVGVSPVMILGNSDPGPL